MYYSQEPSKEAYDFDAHELEADYYITWIHRRAENLNHLRHTEDDDEYRSADPDRFLFEQMCFDVGFPDNSRDTVIQLKQPDNHRKTKQTDRDGKPLWINIKWKDVLDVQYKGHYTDKVCSTFKYDESQLEFYDFSEECELYFGAVRDDNGNPFLRLRLEYGSSDWKEKSLSPWGPMEMVAKKITNDGPGEFGKRDLSKNEKLRLGFPMDAWGNFKEATKLLEDATTPTKTADDQETVDSIEKRMRVLTSELGTLREKGEKILENWWQRLDQALIPSVPSMPTLRRGDPFLSSSTIRKKRGRHSDGDTNGHSTGKSNSVLTHLLPTKGDWQTPSSNRDTDPDASPRQSRDVSLLSLHQISRQRSPPHSTDVADELAAPGSLQKATKRPKFENGRIAS